MYSFWEFITIWRIYELPTTGYICLNWYWFTPLNIASNFPSLLNEHMRLSSAGMFWILNNSNRYSIHDLSGIWLPISSINVIASLAAITPLGNAGLLLSLSSRTQQNEPI